MTLTVTQTEEISAILLGTLRRKFTAYKPEPAAMPFHTRLLGQDRMALFSFVQSLNTSFGTSIFEPVAAAIAKHSFASVTTQAIAGHRISTACQHQIQNILNELRSARSMPNAVEELTALRSCCQSGEYTQVKLTRVDLMLVDRGGTVYLIDIKTAKPNASNFKEMKNTLLEWCAAVLADAPTAQVRPLVAIPYNPYHPEPYSRWTMRGMLDVHQELKVADEFWDFLGGHGTYDQLLELFAQAGETLRPEIDRYFAKFAAAAATQSALPFTSP